MLFISANTCHCFLNLPLKEQLRYLGTSDNWPAAPIQLQVTTIYSGEGALI